MVGGLATGAVVILFVYSYAVAAGAPVPSAWKALPPLIVVTVAELALALGLRRYCRQDYPPSTPSSKAQADQSGPGG